MDSQDPRSLLLSRLPGMDMARATALLRLLPALGRAPTSILLQLAGLDPPTRSGWRFPCPVNEDAIQGLLMSAYLIARRDTGTRLQLLLQRLHSAHPDEHPRLCLAAILRHCNDALRHAAHAGEEPGITPGGRK